VDHGVVPGTSPLSVIELELVNLEHYCSRRISISREQANYLWAPSPADLHDSSCSLAHAQNPCPAGRNQRKALACRLAAIRRVFNEPGSRGFVEISTRNFVAYRARGPNPREAAHENDVPGLFSSR